MEHVSLGHYAAENRSTYPNSLAPKLVLLHLLTSPLTYNYFRVSQHLCNKQWFTLFTTALSVRIKPELFHQRELLGILLLISRSTTYPQTSVNRAKRQYLNLNIRLRLVWRWRLNHLSRLWIPCYKWHMGTHVSAGKIFFLL